MTNAGEVDVRKGAEIVDTVRWCGNSDFNIKVTNTHVKIPAINMFHTEDDNVEVFIKALRLAHKECKKNANNGG